MLPERRLMQVLRVCAESSDSKSAGLPQARPSWFSSLWALPLHGCQSLIIFLGLETTFAFAEELFCPQV